MHCFVNHPVKMIVPRYGGSYSFAKCVFYIATLVAAISMKQPEREGKHSHWNVGQGSPVVCNVSLVQKPMH